MAFYNHNDTPEIREIFKSFTIEEAHLKYSFSKSTKARKKTLLVLGMNEKEAVTISFLTLAFAQLWHVFNMRDRSSGVFSNAVVRNPFIWGALALCTVLLLLTVYVPLLADILKIANPGFAGWMLIAGFSFLPLIAGQVVLIGLKRKE